MSHIKNEKYHAPIDPTFLLDINKKFKSEITPWVYLILKLKYQYYIDNASYLYYKIDLKYITQLYNLHKSTTYKAIAELKEIGLIEKKNRKYRILDEKDLSNESRVVAPEDRLPKFIKINNNYFFEKLLSLKLNWGDPVSNNELIIKSLRVYYYLVAKNGHCIAEASEKESDETQTSICRVLNHDNRTIKEILSVLQDAGYVRIEDDGRLITINKSLQKEKEQAIYKKLDSKKEANVYDINRNSNQRIASQVGYPYFNNVNEEDYVNEDEGEYDFEDGESGSNTHYGSNHYSLPVPA